MFGNTLKKKKSILSVNVPFWYLLPRVFNCKSLRYQETCTSGEKSQIKRFANHIEVILENVSTPRLIFLSYLTF